MGILKMMRDARGISSPYMEMRSPTKNMTSDLASEVAKYPENPQIAQNGDLNN